MYEVKTKSRVSKDTFASYLIHRELSYKMHAMVNLTCVCKESETSSWMKLKNTLYVRVLDCLCLKRHYLMKWK